MVAVGILHFEDLVPLFVACGRIGHVPLDFDRFGFNLLQLGLQFLPFFPELMLHFGETALLLVVLLDLMPSFQEVLQELAVVVLVQRDQLGEGLDRLGHDLLLIGKVLPDQ